MYPSSPPPISRSKPLFGRPLIALWVVGAGLSICAASAPSASAQSPEAPPTPTWLVLPAVVGELNAEGRRLADSAEGALADRSRPVIDPDDLPDFGTDPQTLPVELIARLQGEVQPALEDAAFGRRARVLSRVTPLLEDVSRYLDALGEHPIAARAVTDLALIAARVHNDDRDEAAARATIERLLSFAPTPDPSVDFHPHEILSLLSRVREALGQGSGQGNLRITATDSGGCNGYLNGQLIGPTPLALDLYRGDYAVRVQCGELRSRIHRTHLESGREAVAISASLESALSRHPRLHLHYEDEAALAARGPQDAALVGAQSGAAHTVLLQLRSDGLRAQILRPGAERGHSQAVQQAPLQPSSEELHDAWVGLLDAPDILQADGTPSEGGGWNDSHWNWVIGGAFVAGGIGAAISPIITISQIGTCSLEDAGGNCLSEVAFGVQSGILLGVSALALTAGIVWMAWQPIEVSVQTDATSARLMISGDF